MFIPAPYADPRAIAREQLDLLLPRTKLTVAQYAKKHRKLSNPGGGYSGDWNHDLAPYLVEPMECLTGLAYQTVAVVKPGQCGGTEIAQNWLLKSVADDPANMLWYMQTDDALEDFVKARINTMIELHPGMKDRLGTRPVDDTLHAKQFRGMRASFLAATHSNLISKNAPRLVLDEIDAYLKSLGNVKALADIRRQTYGRQSKILALSHPDRGGGLKPDRDWNEGILAIYKDSDRRCWYWPCPFCGAFSSPVPIAARVMTLHYPEGASLDEIEREARLVCPVSGCLIEDSYRRDMNRYGRWIGLGQEIAEDGSVSGQLIRSSTAGFWIVGFMSPFVLGGIGAMARARVKAERELEVSGDDKSLRQVMVKSFGIPLTSRRVEGTVSANELADRAEPGLMLGVVPKGVRFLTCAVDVQLRYFEWLVRGWGVKGESWVIAGGKIDCLPAVDPEAWDQLLANVLQQTFPLADGSGRRMGIRGSGYDSAGAPGVTLQAYSAWTRWRRRAAVRLFGKVAGREVWSILPSKGASAPAAQRLLVTYPDTTRQANASAGSGNVPVAIFNPNNFKDDLAGQLMRAEPGAWYVHFPHALRSEEAPHVWFEELVAEQPNKRGVWEEVRPGARNEKLDLMALNHVIAHLHGLTRIQWDRAPSWADEWDRNTLVKAAPAVPADEQPAVPAAIVVPGFAGETRPPATPPPAVANKPDAVRRSLVSRFA